MRVDGHPVVCRFCTSQRERACLDLVGAFNSLNRVLSLLIALNKNLGTRPIGIGDTARRIIAKAILLKCSVR